MNPELKIVLCSASPRRQQLLKELGFHFETMVKDVDEQFPVHLKAEHVALFLAEKKAGAFSPEFRKDSVYITADTIVWLENEVLNKPAGPREAIEMLKKLSGKTHQVYTGVCLAGIAGRTCFCVRSDVEFNKLTEDEIRYYVNDYEPFDKAGSYGAQECLPEGMNPCSDAEKAFMKTNSHPDLFEKTMLKNKKHMPIIKRIEGSYFNVMGLPVVELYNEIMNYEL